MFTGLVAEQGTIKRLQRSEDGVRLVIAASLDGELREGDSVAVNGVCLTATEVRDGEFTAEVMNQTLERTALADARTDASVNLELPLRACDRLGGHMVQGHVDGVGRLVEVTPDGFARRLRIEADPALLRYVVQTGSIAVDGVSLTVADVDEETFTVSLIPETLQRTNLRDGEPGATVNLEVDVLAKYVEKLVSR